MKGNASPYLKLRTESSLPVRSVGYVLAPAPTSSESDIVAWISVEKSYCETDAIGVELSHPASVFKAAGLSSVNSIKMGLLFQTHKSIHKSS